MQFGSLHLLSPPARPRQTAKDQPSEPLGTTWQHDMGWLEAKFFVALVAPTSTIASI